MNTAVNVRFAVAPPALPVVPVLGQDRVFPLRRIWCVGRNYEEHAREMGADPAREPPFFFAKPADAVVPGGGALSFPLATSELHHEVELAVAIGAPGVNVESGAAHDLVFGYAVALDMTRRDLQAEAKKAARPWDLAKGFDQSCPISPIRSAAEIGNLASARLRLAVNGVERQSGDVADMIWSVADCIAALSKLVELRAGDLVLTGTPSGVGPVHRGDQLDAECEHVGCLSVTYGR